MIAALGALAIAGLFAIFLASGSEEASSGAGEFAYQVGDPGPGQPAPPMELPSTEGGSFDLAAYRGERVVIYFQEGVMCQACWDQLRDIEASWDRFEALGIDRIVSISGDQLAAVEDKVSSEGLTTPALADPGLEVSRTYDAHLYGMMGTSANGHTFVVVGPDGTIEWRADYGGEPDYTMYVPVDPLLADLREGLGVEAS